VLVDDVPIQTTVTAHPRTNWAAAAPTTENARNLEVDCQKFRACGSSVPSRTLKWWTLVLAQGPVVGLVTPVPSRLDVPPM
jgi:hypothetical protein